MAETRKDGHLLLSGGGEKKDDLWAMRVAIAANDGGTLSKDREINHPHPAPSLQICTKPYFRGVSLQQSFAKIARIISNDGLMVSYLLFITLSHYVAILGLPGALPATFSSLLYSANPPSITAWLPSLKSRCLHRHCLR